MSDKRTTSNGLRDDMSVRMGPRSIDYWNNVGEPTVSVREGGISVFFSEINQERGSRANFAAGAGWLLKKAIEAIEHDLEFKKMKLAEVEKSLSAYKSLWGALGTILDHDLHYLFDDRDIEKATKKIQRAINQGKYGELFDQWSKSSIRQALEEG